MNDLLSVRVNQGYSTWLAGKIGRDIVDSSGFSGLINDAPNE